MKKAIRNKLKKEVELLCVQKGIAFEKKFLQRAKKVYNRQDKAAKKNFSLLA